MIGFSAALGYMMAIMQAPAKASDFFLTVASNKSTFLPVTYVPALTLWLPRLFLG